MTHYLYYPRSACSLDDIVHFVCGKQTDDTAKGKLKAANYHIKNAEQLNHRGTPIILPDTMSSSTDLPICTAQEHRRLDKLSRHVGGVATLALAELIDELKIPSFASDMNTFGGNGIGAAAKASSFMINDIAHYDKLLKEYYDLKNHRAAPATLMRKEVELKSAFTKMNKSLNRRGQHILQKHKSKNKQVVTQTGKVGFEPIPINNQADARRLAKLAKFGKVAGPGFMLMDGYFRYDKVATMYNENNSNWKREAAVQSSGFLAGIAAGAAIVFVIGTAPVGLVVGIVAAGGAAVVADKTVTGMAGYFYDKIF